jgi:hypothetical protein
VTLKKLLKKYCSDIRPNNGTPKEDALPEEEICYIHGEGRKQGCVQGIVLACSILVNSHGYIDEACYILDCCGVGKKDCKDSDVDDHDIKTLAPVFALQARKKKQPASKKSRRPQ